MRNTFKALRSSIKRGSVIWVLLVSVRCRPIRRCLNIVYNRLSLRAKARLHTFAAKIFRSRDVRGVSAEWAVNVGGAKVVIPLRSPSLWLDWDCALSVLGHDTEIKETYLDLIGRRAVDLFVDVGANYGMHSMLFLCNDIRTVTVEPNPDCLGYFSEIAARNNVVADVRNVALGSEAGEVVLSYPEKELWLGAVSAASDGGRGNEPGWISQSVRMATLDDIVTSVAGNMILVKIDTEGFELNVLRGGSKLLRERRPLVIFESFRGESRSGLFDLIEDAGMAIHRLPWKVLPDQREKCMRHDEFVFCDATNFIAVPIEIRS